MAEEFKQHFVLVHGAGGGAWFWYKIVNLLQISGHKVTAIDLAACGINSKNHADISSFKEYNQPLEDFFTRLPENEKVVLVAHSWGGFNVTYSTEKFTEKVALAVYVTAPMVPEDQAKMKGLDIMGKDSHLVELFFGNGDSEPPTAMRLKPHLAAELTYALSPPEDVVLSQLLERPVPLAIANLEFATSEERYGSVPRVFIKSLRDKVFPMEVQEAYISGHPHGKLRKVLSVDADHCPPLSAPQELHALLLAAIDSN